LALWQANYVRERLLTEHPDLAVELVKMSTQGDKILDTSLAKVGGKGLFVKELEQRLLDGSIDIAVHSLKDMTVDLPDGLHLSVFCEREDPRDAFVSTQFKTLEELPAGSRVGTSSLRRQAQLRTSSQATQRSTLLACAVMLIRAWPNLMLVTMTPSFSPLPALSDWAFTTALLTRWRRNTVCPQWARVLCALSVALTMVS
jgi:hypothetical protein